ncbi:FecR family protein [Sphingobacterium sp. SYP-B4668]|uniref:FecR family protein n=1 Tax=Sphingobacterium sp. SYP-B4668 TaxID=2996035 RepID=UPI0022DD87C6|nr:FecR family protein [Sphingobacterium sp. SYP-B4668]
MANYRLKYLLWRYANRSIAQDELKELLDILSSDDPAHVDREIDRLIDTCGILEEDVPNFEVEKGLARLKAEIFTVDVVDGAPFAVFPWRKWFATAVAALLILGFGLFWAVQYVDWEEPTVVVKQQDILLSDENNARISLADGTTYDLLKVDDNILHSQGVTIKKDAANQIVFAVLEGEGPVEMKTFINPKGGTAQLILADGTRVWLNSGSTVQYPSRFDTNLRKITVTGEAYFEVTHERTRPFVVKAASSEIKVLGTHFNVKAMEGAKAVYTTLFNGSVQVASHLKKLILVPGQQAIAKENGTIDSRLVNLDDELAWKAGYFRFDDDDIHSVMEQIASWYDIKGYQVEEVTPDLFTGALQRTKKLSDLLGQLEKISNYKFKIKDGEVLVMK